jgi:hypothetical protein
LTKVSIDTIIDMKRPTHSELDQKIRRAKEAASTERVILFRPYVLAGDAFGLGYVFSEIPNLLWDLLEEINPKDYAGQYPPQRSYEDEIFQSELFPFAWMSKRLGCRVYLKFTLKERELWIISLHQERKHTKEPIFD